MLILETDRLRLRELRHEDAPFLIELLNDADFLRYIGDRGVRTVADAERYLDDGPRASYQRHGHGLWLVVERQSGASAGICGLLRRDTLPHADLGFAFLPEARGKGYATEAGRATLTHGKEALGLDPILAITALDNDASIRVLTRLGFAFERFYRQSEDAEQLRLFRWGG
jgi:RimJ/RimL family protein N-acetyltransferase